MDWINIIQQAIDDIEADLCGDMTVTEYIRNRRLLEEN